MTKPFVPVHDGYIDDGDENFTDAISEGIQQALEEYLKQQKEKPKEEDFSFPDHEGRPGLVGGSLPREGGGGDQKIDSKKAVLDTRIEQSTRAEVAEKLGVKIDDIEEGFGLGGNDKFYSKITRLGKEGDSVTVRGYIHVKDNDEVAGQFSRTFLTYDHMVTHNVFAIEPEFQGEHIARNLLESSVKLYDKAGIKIISTDAAGSVGRYAWAMYGFDFSEKEALEQYKTKLWDRTAKSALFKTLSAKDQYKIELGVSEIKHAWEIGAFRIDGDDIGKRTMLNGPAWIGHLDLHGEGRKIFDAYVKMSKERDKLEKNPYSRFAREMADQNSEEFHRDILDMEDEMADFIQSISPVTLKYSFPDHEGRPGLVGGSVARDEGDSKDTPLDELPEKVQKIVARFIGPKKAEPTDDENRGVSDKPKLGQCYDMAARYLMDHDNGEMKLIHGTVHNNDDNPRIIAHAWVDLGNGKIFDGALQKFFDKDSYYKYFNAKEEQNYTHKEMVQQMLKQRHYGPWGETAGVYNKLPEKKKRTRKK